VLHFLIVPAPNPDGFWADMVMRHRPDAPVPTWANVNEHESKEIITPGDGRTAGA
jgi:hypothetical protein